MALKIPPIKSQGIKSKLVPWIMELLYKSRIKIDRWVEPFMGTCVVPINIQAKEYLLADINPHLVEFYTSIQKGIINYSSARKFLQKAGLELNKNGENYYYLVRDRFNNKYDPFDFLFLNRSCFNGMIRFNKSGDFNVPFCKKINRFRDAYVTKICNQIKTLSEFFSCNAVKIVCGDFGHILDVSRMSDIIYCDPPYIDRYSDYYNGWSEDDELRLFSLLDSCGSFFILSTWHHNQFRKNIYLEKLWNRYSVYTRGHYYHLGAKEKNRHEMVEALVTNLACADANKSALRGRNLTQTKIAQYQLL